MPVAVAGDLTAVLVPGKGRAIARHRATKARILPLSRWAERAFRDEGRGRDIGPWNPLVGYGLLFFIQMTLFL